MPARVAFLARFPRRHKSFVADCGKQEWAEDQKDQRQDPENAYHFSKDKRTAANWFAEQR